MDLAVKDALARDEQVRSLLQGRVQQAVEKTEEALQAANEKETEQLQTKLDAANAETEAVRRALKRTTKLTLELQNRLMNSITDKREGWVPPMRTGRTGTGGALPNTSERPTVATKYSPNRKLHV